MKSELARPLLTTTPHQWEDVSALDRFNVHCCPTRWVFSGTGLEFVTRQATIRYIYHSAAAATKKSIVATGKITPVVGFKHYTGDSPCTRDSTHKTFGPTDLTSTYSMRLRRKTARGGRVRSTTPAEDRYIVLSAKRNRRTTAQQVAYQFLAASEKQISRKTVARRLRGGGLYARRPVVCVPLTRQHRTARLQWCREHHNWTEQDWACLLFSDESRFSLSSDCRRQLIWRKIGTAYRPENIQEKDRYPTCSIMVWAGIMINGRTRLHVVANGTMTGQRYIDEVLLPHVRLFRGAVGDKFVFMDDSATCHRTLAVQDCLDSESIQRLVLPARSPDLNSIENVWDALGRQVADRNYPPTNKNTLIRALTEE
ncbi:transposable element Tcb1 transposase [Trichonephila clavipes]|nr:transposable element Tcb1 transposase [Trichonephila clavipes]